MRLYRSWIIHLERLLHLILKIILRNIFLLNFLVTACRSAAAMEFVSCVVECYKAGSGDIFFGPITLSLGGGIQFSSNTDSIVSESHLLMLKIFCRLMNFWAAVPVLQDTVLVGEIAEMSMFCLAKWDLWRKALAKPSGGGNGGTNLMRPASSGLIA